MPTLEASSQRLSGEGPVWWSARHRSEVGLGFVVWLVSKPAWRGGPMHAQPAVPHTIRALCFPGPCRSICRIRSNSTGLGGVHAFGFSCIPLGLKSLDSIL